MSPASPLPAPPSVPAAEPPPAFRERTSGVLLHVTSLPSLFGAGDLGPAARGFVDFLARARQRWWQTLPWHPPDPFGSPYGSSSCFAGSPLLVSPEELAGEGLLTDAELRRARVRPTARFDVGRVAAARDALLRRAFERFRGASAGRDEVAAFLSKSRSWLPDWALYASLKRAHGGRPWHAWPRRLRRRTHRALDEARRELADEIDFHVFVQHRFRRQAAALRGYANEHGVRLLGDLPIYAAHDSADVWAHPGLFRIGRDGQPTHEAGTPPDYFAPGGQRWGLPVYRWDRHRATRFAWWVRRVQGELELFDALRLDHFLGFVRTWSFATKGRRSGRYRPGPGLALFRALQRRLGDLPLAAEDLGDVSPGANELRDRLGLPGMRVLQFGFDGAPAEVGESWHLPPWHTPNALVYTGTHDNDTTRGWFAKRRGAARRVVLDYLGCGPRDVTAALVRAALQSVARTAILPMQDVLDLGSRARMNRPGTARGNWAWRLTPGQASARVADGLARVTRLAGR